MYVTCDLPGADVSASTDDHLEPEEERGRVPRVGVVLAAGKGLRMEQQGIRLPKPLIRVGGLPLVERAMLTLAAAGVERIRLVLGADAGCILAAVRRMKRLGDIEVEPVICDDWELGNGLSLRAGVRGLDEPFLLAMADHIVSVDMVRELIEGARREPHLPHLLVDLRPDGVFDLADATKVRFQGTMIAAIGKELQHLDAIDTGLFHFPAGAKQRINEAIEAGARSVSDVVRAFDRFGTVAATRPRWQDVDNLAMVRQAERLLRESLPKATDGVISRLLNRPISTRISQRLARWGVTPNWITTAVTLITLLGAGMVVSTNYWWVLLGAVIFHLASVLDGCDGEVARLTHSGSKTGAFYDTVSDNVRYTIFFLALGVGRYRQTGAEVYLWAVVLFVAVFAYVSAVMARWVRETQEHLTNLAVVAAVEGRLEQDPNWWDRAIVSVRKLVKQDVVAFLVLMFALVGGAHVLFWLALAGLLVMTVAVVRVIGRH